MGFLRSGFVVLLSVLFFVSLLTTGLFATVSSSLSYENVQPKISSIATQIVEEQIGESEMVGELTPYLETYCIENSEVTYELEGYTFVFPCEVLKQSTENIVAYGVNYLIEDFYYKNYTCDFWECFEEEDMPLFLVSEYGRDYWKSWFIKSFLISLLLATGMILLSRKKSNGFVLTGAITVFVSLIVLKFGKIGAFIFKMIISPVSSALSAETSQVVLTEIVDVFFSSSGKVFLWMFIIALILIGVGILLRLFRIGFKISDFFKRIEGEPANTKAKKNPKQPAEVKKDNKSKKK